MSLKENACVYCGLTIHRGAGGMWRDEREKSVCLEAPDEVFVHKPDMTADLAPPPRQAAPKNGRPHEVDALFWASLGKVASTEKDVEKSLIGDKYGNGQGEYFRSTRGMRLGQVRRNDPDPSWQFTDKAAFEAYIRAEHPGVVETRFEIAATNAQVVSALVKHAPELLRDVEVIPDEVFTDALKHSKETGEAAGPGIEWVQPQGSLVVTPDKAAVEFLRQSMRVELDQMFPKELPAGEEREAS